MFEVKIKDGRWKHSPLYNYQIPVRHMVPGHSHEVVYKVMIDDVDDITSRGMTREASSPGPCQVCLCSFYRST
jgi:hypothetical protein